MTLQRSTIGIKVEGGTVTEIISNNPAAFAGFRFIVIDKDGEQIGEGTSAEEFRISRADAKDSKYLQDT